MIYLPIVCLTLALVVAVLLLVRERRLRLALELLLRRLLRRWSTHEPKPPSDSTEPRRGRRDRL